MPLTSADYVRQRIQDPLVYEDATYYGDGTANRYKLPHVNLQSGSAWVAPGATAWSATGATFNVTGYVDFANAISAQTAFRVAYVHSVWSDETISGYLSAGISGAMLQCAYDLLYDNMKRSRWMAANGAQYDNMQAGQFAKDIISAIKDEMREEATQYGSMASWAETQGEY